MRSTERVNSRGVGRSMGYGFVELSTHKATLSALQAINNNPDLYGSHKVSQVTMVMYIVLLATVDMG